MRPTTAANSYTLTCAANGQTDFETVTIAVTPSAGSTVSGRILVAPDTQTDSDTNDGVATPVSNNTFQVAQQLMNPVVVGGYVNRPGEGETGPSRTNGDISDYFSVALVAGQVIELVIADPDPGVNDLDVELYRPDFTLVNASVGVTNVERMTAAVSGQYYIRVFAYGGASNYVLSIGQSATTTSAGTALRDDFVAGELLAKPSRGLMAGAAKESERDKVLRDSMGLVVSNEIPDMYVSFRLDTDQRGIAQKSSLEEDVIRFASEDDRLKYQTLIALKELQKDAAFEWAQVNYVYAAYATPNDPEYSKQRWHYELVNLPAAWNVTVGAGSVTVAVIDSGVRRHAELGVKLVDGYDFVLGGRAGDGDGEDADASDPGALNPGGDYNFHGTHVAGTVAALSNNGMGVAGVAWGAQIMPVRVLGADGFGTGEDIITGILYAARQPNRSGRLPARRADVINLSLGGDRPCAPAEQQAINAARSAGVVVVAAAGNSNIGSSGSPGSCAGVISVSSINSDKSKAHSSNYGSNVDIAAPGGFPGVFSTHSVRSGQTYTNSYAYMMGTSMAAPHVAGVIALMKSVNSALTPSAIDALLANGALTDDIGPTGPDALGMGLVNAYKAVTAAATLPLPSRPAQLAAQPSLINFGGALASIDINVANTGTGAMSVTGYATSAPWLLVTPVRVDASGLGVYRASVNRTGLPANTYAGWIEFRGSAGSAIRVPVQMQVGVSGISIDAGQHYVLLIDPATNDTEYQTEVYARGASTTYSISGVANGRYMMAAGTDLDNDGYICDEGEACAEYPEFGEPIELEISNSRNNLDVSTTYRVNIRAAAANEAESVTIRSGHRRLRR